MGYVHMFNMINMYDQVFIMMLWSQCVVLKCCNGASRHHLYYRNIVSFCYLILCYVVQGEEVIQHGIRVNGFDLACRLQSMSSQI